MNRPQAGWCGDRPMISGKILSLTKGSTTTVTPSFTGYDDNYNYLATQTRVSRPKPYRLARRTRFCLCELLTVALSGHLYYFDRSAA